MRVSPGRYVRAIFDFQTTQSGEISLTTGEIILVTKVVDENWICGLVDAREGNFPINFVEEADVPKVTNDQKLFLAAETFRSTECGDLNFSKGEIILGLKSIDDNWWKGCVGSKTGIFPKTFVKDLPTLSKPPKQKSTASVKNDTTKSKPHRESSVHVPFSATALVDITPQLDEELGFKAGEVLTIIEIVDNDWLNAELHGKVGLVSSVCVDLPKDFNVSKNDEQPLNNTTSSLYSYLSTSSETEKYSYIKTDTSKSCDVYTDPYKIEADGNVYAYLDAYNASIDENGGVSDKAGLYSYTSENTRSADVEITPYARVIYPFLSQASEELTISKNDIVTLIQHVDSDWIEGELDGKIGLFPASYVEIIVDCPYAYNQSETSGSNDDLQITEKSKSDIDSTSVDNIVPISRILDNEASTSTISDDNNQQTTDDNGDSLVRDDGIACDELALVKFSINSQNEHDLSIREGDTITIVTRYADNWLQAKDENGNIGLVPSNYVEIIKPGPGTLETNTECAIISQHNHQLTDKIGQRAIEQSTSTGEKVHEREESDSENLTVPDVEILSDSDTLSSNDNYTENSVEDLSECKKHVPSLKPKLAPKPCLKPKPAIPTKPFIKTQQAEIPSESSINSQKTEIPSRSSINFQKTEIPSESSINSQRAADSSVEQTVSSSIEKVFPQIDISKSLDCIIASELIKAKGESKDANLQHENIPALTNTFDSVTQPVFPVPTGRSATSKPDLPACSNKFQISTSLNHDDFTKSRGSAKHEPTRPKPPRPKSVSFGRSNFYLNDAFVTETDEDACSNKGEAVAQGRGSFKNKSSTRVPPPRPQVPSGSSHKPRPLPARPAPIAPSRRITPGRPAPPRPTSVAPARKRLSTSQPNLSSTPNLMTFSPEEQAEDENNADDIADLKNRISEIEDDLQKYIKSKEDVILMLRAVTGEKEEEIKENLGFYEANISGLTEECKTLKENLYQLSPKERRAAEILEAMERQKEEEKQRIEKEQIQQEIERKKRKEKREKIIDEIIDTEKTFLYYLQITMETFLGPNSEKISQVDYDRLFGNMVEIAHVSQRFLTSLENDVIGKPFADQIIGASFIRFSEDMKNTYAPYCRNHDEVITYMEKYKSVPEIKEYFQRTINSMREYCNVFDLDALLIKPVQRILKYPLLIGELLRVTEDDHVDKQEVMKAINTVTNVAKAINEYKRRKDLVYKYKKESDASFGDMISKLSLHTLKKKSNRIRGRLTTTMGISLQTKDENFEKEEYKFRHLEKAVKVLLKNIQTYLDNLQESISCEESWVVSIEDFYGDKTLEEVKRFQSLYKKVSLEHFPNLRLSIEQLVVIPLNKLVSMFNGPVNVIEKRFDKLLDYDNLFKKSKDTEKYNDALASAKNDYEAMNAQLLDELPKLYTLAFKVFKDCISCFVHTQKNYLDASLQETYTLLDLPFVLGAGESFIEMFNVKHTSVLDRISGLSFIPRGFNPKYDSLHRQDSIRAEKKNKRVSLDTESTKTTMSTDSVQSESRKVFIIQQFLSDKLYRVSRNYTAADLMDLSLQQGTVVGVLKQQDPMGNKDKWFVDDGVSKGFIHKSVLTLFHQQSSPPGSTAGLMDESISSNSSVSYYTGNMSVNLGNDSGNLGDCSGSISGNLGDSSSNMDNSTSSLGNSTGNMSGNLGDSVGSYSDSYNDPLQEEMDSILEDLEDSEKSEVHEYYYSEYSFSSRSPNEVTLFEGQVVTVLAKHDQDGNTEWWYVDADGNHGYAPSNYLKAM